jgi:hypothetical protein
MMTSLDFHGAHLIVTRTGRSWDVEVNGRHHQARYLDVALDAALPHVSQVTRTSLAIELLEWASTNQIGPNH